MAFSRLAGLSLLFFGSVVSQEGLKFPPLMGFIQGTANAPDDSSVDGACAEPTLKMNYCGKVNWQVPYKGWTKYEVYVDDMVRYYMDNLYTANPENTEDQCVLEGPCLNLMKAMVCSYYFPKCGEFPYDGKIFPPCQSMCWAFKAANCPCADQFQCTSPNEAFINFAGQNEMCTEIGPMPASPVVKLPNNTAVAPAPAPKPVNDDTEAYAEPAMVVNEAKKTNLVMAQKIAVPVEKHAAAAPPVLAPQIKMQPVAAPPPSAAPAEMGTTLSSVMLAQQHQPPAEASEESGELFKGSAQAQAEITEFIATQSQGGDLA